MGEQRRAAEINDIICEAIETIIAARTSELPFDRTIVCTITNIDERDKGKYEVTDGSMVFTAYSDYYNYTMETKVNVLIPGNDWTQQKTIISKYNNDQEQPVEYMAPLEGIRHLTNNLTSEIKQIAITANGDKITHTLFEQELKLDREKYDTLCVSAQFKTAIGLNKRITSGSYGLRIYITGINKDKEKETAVFTLASDVDMFGNVYNYLDWIDTEQAWKIPETIENIISIQIDLYQSGTFKAIDDSFGENDIIELNNLNIYFGNTNSSMANPIIDLIDSDEDKLLFSPNNITRTVSISWHALSDMDEIVWYKDNIEGTPEEFNRGVNLKEVTFDCTYQLSSMNLYAIVIKKDEDNKEYKSNVLTFTNKIDKTNQVMLKDIRLVIENGINSKDSYLYKYKQTDDGYTEKAHYAPAASESEAVDVPRELKIIPKWSRGKEWPINFWNDVIIKYNFPSDNTMLIPKYRTQQDTIIEENQEFYFSCPYYIKDIYDDNYVNNTIEFEISFPKDKIYSDEEKLTGSKRFRFILDKSSLEEKTWASIGTPADDPEAGTIYSYINAQKYMTVEGVFNGLTNNGTLKGIFPTDADGKTDEVINPDGTINWELVKDLYINASYISTGVLRSENWNGLLKYKADEYSEEVIYGSIEEAQAAVNKGEASWITGTWIVQSTSGTYWNLNNGQLLSNQFEFNALTDVINEDTGIVFQKGLYLNSNPNENQAYLTIGDPSSNHYMQYLQDGSLIIQTNKFIIDAFDYLQYDENEDPIEGSQQGIYLNSHPKKEDQDGNPIQDYYLQIGNSNSFIEVDNNANIKIRSNDFYIGSSDSYITTKNANDQPEIKIGDIFQCSENGVIIGGMGKIESGSYTEANGIVKEGLSINLNDGSISTAGLSITDGENYLILDRTNGITTKINNNKIIFQAGVSGISLTTSNYSVQEGIEQETTITSYYYRQIRAKRNAGPYVNIRPGPGTSYTPISSFNFIKDTTYCFKLKNNAFGGGLDTSNTNWLPIFIDGEKKPHTPDTLPLDSPPAFGYVWYQGGGSSSILFDKAEGTDTAIQKTISSQRAAITGATINFTNTGASYNNYIRIGAGIDGSILIGGSDGYALQIGKFKVDWQGNLTTS